ncbi:MAG TPA: hypothetical protein VMV18_11770 [bacterium]|nr:hypothetical protein [bacterium]
MRVTHALAALTILFSAGAARAAGAPTPTEGDLPDQVVGITLRLTGGGFLGSNAEHVSEPELGFGGSLHVHVYEGLFVDVSYDQRVPALVVSSSGSMISLGVGQETVGLRERLPLNTGSDLVLGLGAGGATLHQLQIQSSTVYGGAVVYGTLGWEKQLTWGRETGAASYVGVEAVWNHYLISPDVGFHGGLGEVRATFTYYFGRGDLNDCR